MPEKVAILNHKIALSGELAMRFLFGECTLDAERRELKRAGRVIHVEPQVFDVLVHLINHRDHVVSKDELIAAVWQGRIVSDSTLSSRITAARQAIGDSGEQQSFIRTVARRGFRFVGDLREVPSTPDGGGGLPALERDTQTPADDATALTDDKDRGSLSSPDVSLPDRPSIAVLAFANLSGDPEQEYFADGLVEEIITALSRFKNLFVIARNSSFTYKGRPVDVKRVGHELGVRYVLEGSVRAAARRVRITAQLIDAMTGAHLWADRFDGDLEDVFDLQDRVATDVMGAIAPKLEDAEIERAKRKPTESLDAYNYYLRGLSVARQLSSEALEEALGHFHRAIRLDSEFAAAYGMICWCYFRRYSNALIATAGESAEAIKMARRAVALGSDDPIALCMGGITLAGIAFEMEAADAYLDRALALNRNLAIAWSNSGLVKIWMGEHASAIARITTALRLNPLDPLVYRVQALLAYAYFFSGQNKEALLWADKAILAQPLFLPAEGILAACYARAGRIEDARRIITRMLQHVPNITISNFPVIRTLRRRQDVIRFGDELRRAGLPE